MATGIGVIIHAGQPVVALEKQPILPTTLAVKAASTSVTSCDRKGYKVTASVLNPEGNILVVIRNQEAGPHTIENSFNKAYTSVSFGRAYNLDSTRAILSGIKPGKGIGEFPLPASPLKGLSYSVGGINITSNGSLIGSIGVSGSPNGDLDESCAYEGLKAIQAELR
jgi:uncharacterized protein GlcG (DUF336 family)